MNAFRAACAAAGEDFYDRLVYYVSDSSPRTVAQWAERGQFDSFGGHVAILTSPFGKKSPVNGTFTDANGKAARGPVKFQVDISA